MSKKNDPPHIQTWLQERAIAKRKRRAAKSNASNYAKRNIRSHG